MIYCQSDQGTPQWHKERAGVITASMFVVIRRLVGCLDEKQQSYVDAILGGASEAAAKAIAGYKTTPRAAAIQKALNGEKVGDYSDAAKNYAFRLAIERISGEPLDEGGFETWAMRRGRELEEDCRIRHEAEIEDFVELAGFIHTDDRKFGCSADALIGDDGGGEYKCFVAPDKLRSIIIHNDWGDVQDQVQGSLWLTGRKWWDMCLYCPALRNVKKDFTRLRVQRDETYIENLEADLVEFDKFVCKWERRLRVQDKRMAA